jgi:diguanylate cyclase (GGDEF)-like protein/PAS domain S-box-containing protein
MRIRLSREHPNRSVFRGILWLLVSTFVVQLALLVLTMAVLPEIEGIAEEASDIVLSALLMTPFIWWTTHWLLGFNAHAASESSRAPHTKRALERMYLNDRMDLRYFLALAAIVVIVQTVVLGFTFVLVPHIEGFAEELLDAIATSVILAPIAWLAIHTYRAYRAHPSDDQSIEFTPGESPHHALRAVFYGVLGVLALLAIVEAVIASNDHTHASTDQRLAALTTQRAIALREVLVAVERNDAAATDAAMRNAKLRADELVSQYTAQTQYHSHNDDHRLVFEELDESFDSWQETVKTIDQYDFIRAMREEDKFHRDVDTSGRALARFTDALIAASVAHSSDTRERTVVTGGLVILLILSLALGAIEPFVGFLKRQNAAINAQASRLRQFATVAEQTSNMVAVLDESRRVTSANQAFARLVGRERSEILGQDVAPLLFTSSSELTALDKFRAAVDQGRASRVQFRLRSGDGKDRWLSLDVQSVRNAIGQPSATSIVGTDLTELVTQRLRLQALLDAQPAGVLEVNLEGRIVGANRAAGDIVNMTVEALIGRTTTRESWGVFKDDLAPCTDDERPLARALRFGESVRGEYYAIVPPDGVPRWVIVNAEPLHDASGEIVGAIGCFIDITAQRTNRTLLSLALNTAGIGTWEFQIPTDEYVWSDACAAILGFKPGEFEPTWSSWQSLIHPEDRVAHVEFLKQRTTDTQQAFSQEVRVLHRSGGWAWIETRGTVVERSPDGKPIRMVGLHIDITERKQREEELRRSAVTDALTGLPNRDAFLSRLDGVLGRVVVAGAPRFALLFLDLDHFKQVNDSLGHAAGDALLKLVVHRLQEAVSADAAHLNFVPTIARFGGDEFAVLLELIDAASVAEIVAASIVDVLSVPYVVQNRHVYATASVGVVIDDGAAHGGEELLRNADIAMYQAKRDGRFRYRIYEAQMLERAAARAELESDLRDALDERSLSVAYQPIVSLHGDATTPSVEALARWQHSKRGAVSPASFVHIAEEIGVVDQVGDFVIERALTEFAGWQQLLGSCAPSKVSINLSIPQLRSPLFVLNVRERLEELGLRPQSLQFEITESLPVDDATVIGHLQELKALGVGIALDDFGTGYSSLSRLHQMPITMLKIDRSFVTEATQDRRLHAMVRASVQVARALDLEVVAEGVETESQAALMSELGCDQAQGFFFAKPMFSSELTQWFGNR